MQEYQAYGCQIAEEKSPDWLIYEVLVMGTHGQHDILVFFFYSRKFAFLKIKIMMDGLLYSNYKTLVKIKLTISCKSKIIKSKKKKKKMV
jgi:hypothetical protein